MDEDSEDEGHDWVSSGGVNWMLDGLKEDPMQYLQHVPLWLLHVQDVRVWVLTRVLEDGEGIEDDQS